MSFDSFLKNLKIDIWYKVFVYIGAILIILALFSPVYGLTNKQVFLLGIALFLVGIGEWKNHKIATEIKPPNVYTGSVAIIQYPIRNPDFIGYLFILLGLVALGFLLFTLL